MPFDLTAENVSYDVSGSKVTASGDGQTQVKVVSKSGNLRADHVDYDLKANKVVARGNVAFTDPTGTTVLVDELELTGDLQQGALEQLRLRVPMLGEVATAKSASVSGTTYTMRDVVYSPCTQCINGRKPWTLSADKVVYRQDESDVTYKNAVMDVYGVPVMYLPWFRHPLGPRKPKSGLLPPQFARSQTLGDELTMAGYVNSPAENADYTVRSRMMSSRGTQLMLERRQVGDTTDSEIKASYLNDTYTGKVRSNLNVVAEKDLSAGRRLGINGEITSDDTYLSQYFDRLDPYLASTVYGEDGGDNHYAALSVTRFQDLSPSRAPADTAQVMPHLELQRWFALDSGGQVTLNGDFTNIYRGRGVQDRRFVSEADYSRPWLLPDGSKLTLGAQARIDFYGIDSGTKNGAVTRLLPEATAMWEKPYISPGGNHTIAPQVMLAVSPRGGNLSNKVPNEDSVAYELDTTNLFEPSRFAGYDRVETGPRLIYGLDNRWGDADHTNWRLFVGQSLRRFDDSSLPATGGAATNTSDWVGLMEAAPVDWFSLNSRFRLDNATFIPRRLDSGMQLGRNEGLYARVMHSFLDNGPQELSTELSVPLADDWAFKGRTRDDMANSRLLESEGALVWTRDCYQIELIARRRGFANGDLQPSTDYMLNLKLLTLGDGS